MLGPAQYLDGTLKDAKDIEWSFSHLPLQASPNLSPHRKKMVTPKKASLLKNSAQTQPITGKTKHPTLTAVRATLLS
jgi:hypothetical protein